jgi:hypothetical protein
MIHLKLPIPESYWVIPRRFLAGEYPGGFNRERVRQRMNAFLEAGINTFINLTGPDELPPTCPSCSKKPNTTPRMWKPSTSPSATSACPPAQK